MSSALPNRIDLHQDATKDRSEYPGGSTRRIHQTRASSVFTVCFTLPYARTKITGIGRFVSDLSRKLRAFEVASIVLAPSAPGTLDDYSIRLTGRFLLNLQLGFRTLGTMARLRRQFHILHAQHTHFQSLLGCFAARVFHKPFLLTLHGRVPDPPGLARMIIHRLTERLTVQLSTKVVAVSPYVSQIFSRYRTDIKLIENGVDIEVFRRDDNKRAQVRHELGIGTELTFIFAGRLAASKGVHLLLRAINSPKLEKHRFVLLLVGEPDLHDPSLLEQLRASEALSRVRIIGPTSESLADYLSAADVFVLPSEYEGMPLGLLEAMSVGLPALVSDIPVNRMIIERAGSGWTFRCGDAGDLAKAMDTILTDGIPANSFVRSRTAVVRSNNLEDEACRYYSIYEELLRNQELPTA